MINVEDVLYKFKHCSHEVDLLEQEIEDILKLKDMECEKYPELSCDGQIRGKKKIVNPTLQTVQKLIDRYDQEIIRIQRTIEDKYGDYLKVRKALTKLPGDEQELIRLKYIEMLRGQRLYRTCGYSKPGFIHKQKRTLEKLKKMIPNDTK